MIKTKNINRTKPYTQIGISRVPCLRCNSSSSQQWQICSLSNYYFGLCINCDIALNRLILIFFRIKNWRAIIKLYSSHLLNKYKK